MTRATLLARVLLAVTLAVATGVHQSRAQCVTNVCPPPPGPSGGGGGSDNGNNRALWYAAGGVLAIIAGWAIKTQLFPDPGPGGSPPPAGGPYGGPPPSGQFDPTPPAPRLGSLLPSGGGGGSNVASKSGGSKGSNQGGSQTASRRGFDVPPLGVPFVPDEVILDIPSSVPTATLDAIAARHAMTRVETQEMRLIGRTLHRWRITGGTSVPEMIQNMIGERQVNGAGANFLYVLAQDQSVLVNSDQYAPQKLNLTEAHRLAKGDRILVAIIDSEVDASHPDLAGAITATLDAASEDEKPHSHGTGMAGAIAARRTMLGTAPRVGLLTVRAFSMKANTAEGTTFNILKGLDWAAAQGARVVNMSFAGPADPRLKDALAKAYKKGIVLIAAAGNAGPRSPPLFPAADPNVIAVTATDADDAIFSGANRGDHIAVAAPGVEILAPAPDGTYQFTTGTSVAAAEVSGVAALLIERNPALTPADVKRILMETAQDLGPKGRDRDFGAGLVNALKAVSAARPANRVSSR
jgi:hypothetical protein